MTKKDLYNHLTTLSKYPLSGEDIQYFYNIKIVRSHNVKNIVGTQGQYIIFIPNQGQDIGHWVLINIKGRNIEYFDSYGTPPTSSIIAQIPKTYNITYNTYPYQVDKKDINTCGFHVLFRAFTQKHLNMSLSEYYCFMKTPRDHDKAVVFYTTHLIPLLKYQKYF